MKIVQARPEDEGALRRLLDECQLPFEDITTEHLTHFFVCRQNGRCVGAIGFEPCGEVALLRSLAVHPDMRRRGLGKQLVGQAEKEAKSLGTAAFYLLTTTAPEFFRRLGYDVASREDAPPAIQKTEEFASICPSASVCMMKRLARA